MLSVLFVSSGNSKNFDNVAPFIKTQGESLKDAGIDVQYFPIHGKGIRGYLKAASKLRNYLKENHIDIIHAHYTLSAWAAVLAFPEQPIVLSLMGDDAYGQYIGAGKVRASSRYIILLTYMIQPLVDAIICKSKNIEHSVFLKQKSHLIPNGILFEKVSHLQNCSKDRLGLNSNKKYVLFLGSKESKRKNIRLVKNALRVVNSSDISLIAPHPISHGEVFRYLCAADVFVLCSFMEGSPNVIKEAMACNCPIVATDVGDVRWVLGNTEGCFIASFDPVDFAEKILQALDFSEKMGRTKGRDRILGLGLDSDSVAKRVIKVYKRILKK